MQCMRPYQERNSDVRLDTLTPLLTTESSPLLTMQSGRALEMPVSPALALLVTFGVWLTMLGDLDDSQVMGVIQALVLLIVLEVIVFTGSGGPGPPSSQVYTLMHIM